FGASGRDPSGRPRRSDRRCRTARSADARRHPGRVRGGDLACLLPLRVPGARGAAMTSPDAHQGADIAERTERRWMTISVIVMIVLAVMAAVAGIHQATMPQPRVETI